MNSIDIQRDHPIFQGGTNPHRIEGGLPNPPSLGVVTPGPARQMGPVGPGEGSMSSGPKIMPGRMAQNIRGEQLQRVNTPFQGQPGPLKREAGAQGYDTTDNGLNMAEGLGQPNGPSMPDFQGIGQKVVSAGKSVSGLFQPNPEEQADNARRYRNYQEDSAAVANARKWNR